MADFSSTEKINASWKHLFGILGTSNAVPGKNWYEETLAATHIITPLEIWSDSIAYAANRTQARANCGSIIEDRSDSINITLVSNGSNWDIVSTFTPKIGFQLTNIHPNPTYIKSIINVVDNGSGNYTITLNNNSGVSAGSSVLHRRIFLTSDPSTNGLAWFARSIYGDSFSTQIENLMQPQKFGIGYTVRVFQANGTEILTTHGAWIINWQKGCLLFAKGFTPVDLSYTQPIYIEAFKYIGTFGLGSSLPSGELHDTLRFDGIGYVPNSSLKADGNDVFIKNKLTVSGSLVIPSGITPSGSSVSGINGELVWDNNFMYLKTPAGWVRSDFRLF